MVRLLVVLACGCGRVAFDPLGDTVDAEASCWAAWRTGAPTLSTPVALPGINTPDASENNPFISDDNLTLYFVSNRSESSNVWFATRTSRSADFVLQGRDLSISPQSAGTVALLPDLLTVFVSDRTDAAENFKISIGTRSAIGAPFTRSTSLVAALASGASEFDAVPTRDGLRLYFARTVNNTDLYVATRTSETEPFASPVPLEGFTSPLLEADPVPFPDELGLLYSFSGDTGDRDLYVATRTSTSLPFTNPQRLAINSLTGDQDPSLSSDGCDLYFHSQRDGSEDIYLSHVEP